MTAKNFGEYAGTKSNGVVRLHPGSTDSRGLICHEPKSGSSTLLDYALRTKKVVTCCAKNKFADDAVAVSMHEIRVVQTRFEFTIETRFGGRVKFLVYAYGEPRGNRCLFRLSIPKQYSEGVEHQAISGALRGAGLTYQHDLKGLSQASVINFLKAL